MLALDFALISAVRDTLHVDAELLKKKKKGKEKNSKHPSLSIFLICSVAILLSYLSVPPSAVLD